MLYISFQVRFTAFRAYFTALPWTATLIMDVSDAEDVTFEERSSAAALQKSISATVKG